MHGTYDLQTGACAPALAEAPGTPPRSRAPLRRRLYDRLRLNFALYPGIDDYRAAHFLTPYYEHRKAALGWAGRFANLLVYLGFQAWLPWRTRAVARTWGKDRAWARRTLAICRERFADPNDIALFRIERPDELDHFMRRFEHIGVGRAIAFAATDHSRLLTDKRRFYDLCAARGVPHPRVLAVLAEGKAEAHDTPAPGQRLFLKPAKGSGGKAARSLTYAGDAGGFRHFLAALPESRRGSWIVQARVEAHPVLRDLAPFALPTVRISTMLDETGAPEIVTTVLRLAASADRVVDNIGLGGLSVPVDPLSGRLGPACGGMAPGEYDRHPLTRAPIEGRVLPEWEAMRRLALDTHRAHFAGHVMIGWDIAVSAPEPCLLEGNPRPSIIMAQRATRQPAGKTRLGALIAYHLDRRAAEGRGRPAFIGD